VLPLLHWPELRIEFLLCPVTPSDGVGRRPAKLRKRALGEGVAAGTVKEFIAIRLGDLKGALQPIGQVGGGCKRALEKVPRHHGVPVRGYSTDRVGSRTRASWFIPVEMLPSLLAALRLPATAKIDTTQLPTAFRTLLVALRKWDVSNLQSARLIQNARESHNIHLSLSESPAHPQYAAQAEIDELRGALADAIAKIDTLEQNQIALAERLQLYEGLCATLAVADNRK